MWNFWSSISTVCALCHNLYASNKINHEHDERDAEKHKNQINFLVATFNLYYIKRLLTFDFIKKAINKPTR